MLGLSFLTRKQGNADCEHSERYKKSKVSPSIRVSGHFTFLLKKKKGFYINCSGFFFSWKLVSQPLLHLLLHNLKILSIFIWTHRVRKIVLSISILGWGTVTEWKCSFSYHWNEEFGLSNISFGYYTFCQFHCYTLVCGSPKCTTLQSSNSAFENTRLLNTNVLHS